MASKPVDKPPATPAALDDDEDVDDLDDVLQEFSKPAPHKPATTASSSSHPGAAPSNLQDHAEPSEEELALIEAEFAAELAAGMEALMKGMPLPNPPASAGPGPAPPKAQAGTSAQAPLSEDEERKMQEAFAKLLMQDMEKAQGAPPSKSSGSAPSSTAEPPNDFQKTIREAVERLKNSDDTNNKAAAGDPLTQLLASLGDFGGMDDADFEEDGQMQSLLENMMSQLLSKELLYEPMKELDDKYPDYFVHNTAKLSKEDLEKYQKQHILISRVIKLYEDPAYSDDDPAKSKEVIDLMQEIQALGAPPAEIMGELPPGMALGPDGAPSLEGMEGCIVS